MAEVNRPTAREVLAGFFSEHGNCSPVSWNVAKVTERADVRRIEIECSCGDILSVTALEHVLKRVRVGFRNVKTIAG